MVVRKGKRGLFKDQPAVYLGADDGSHAMALRRSDGLTSTKDNLKWHLIQTSLP